MKKIIIIGAGFAGLSAATYLAKEGHDVTVIEKNGKLGGRCQAFHESGFTFDMGPSWYWMPDVFERYFEHFGYKSSDFYELKRLDPSYQVFYQDGSKLELPANYEALKSLFDTIEPGSALQLDAFLKDAKYKYDVGLGEFVHKPSLSIREFMDVRLIKDAMRLDMFVSISKEIRKRFKHPNLIQLLEFPVLFLGAKPSGTPALYSLMNYADIKLGTWYPIGGMAEIPKAMVQIAKELGVTFKTNESVTKLNIENRKITSVNTIKGSYKADAIVSSADYHHTEQVLLDASYRSYSKKYWSKRVMAPSSLLFYVGVDRKVDGLLHHNLFFDTDFEKHSSEIYDTPKWPKEPLFYICCPSKTDDSVAPNGGENLFFLVPLASDIPDDDEKREALFNILVERLEKRIGINITQNIVYKRSFCINDFKGFYNSFRGNAYGLANTLMQTAFMKPKMKSKKIDNLFYAGQLTTPGPGVPPSLISGEVVAKYYMNTIK